MEWDTAERALMQALTDWEADQCPCGCGQPASISLTDSTVPEGERPQWEAGYLTCDAGLYLRQAMRRQAKADEARSKGGEPVETGHYIWQLTRKKAEEVVTGG